MTSRRREGAPRDLMAAKRELGIRAGACQRSRPRSGQETEDEQEGEPTYRRERDDHGTRWAAYLFADGTTLVEQLRGRIRQAKRAAVTDTKGEATARVREWLA